ncbi:MAG TPA: ThiF family adenylyltransferase [Candidatus Limnocylindrales bacterium]|nr:ThiF family adenylyltransferase [Candidatus Limnocylindrales bacterium]
MTSTLVLPTNLMAELDAALREPDESAAVLLVSVVETDEGLRLLGRELWWVPNHGYARRDPDRLTITSDGYVTALARAEAIGATAVWLHTHPARDSSPYPSRHDHKVNDQLAETFRVRSGSVYYGWMVVAPRGAGLTFTGELRTVEQTTVIDRLWLVGERWSMMRNHGSADRSLSAAFDRNVRAFGGGVQAVLADLRVAIVGCGGTGSAVAEQVTRLGVRRLQLFDPKRLSESNLTRVYGSTPADVGRPKAEVLADHLCRLAPDAQIEAKVASITTSVAAGDLRGSDVIFGCTDDNGGRLVLSRLSSYYLVPVIDCGVLLTSDASDRLVGIDGRVTTVTSGSACLVCRDRIDMARALSEALSPEERARRQAEGYAAALPGVEPAVVTYTTAVAAAAVSELLERLIGYGPIPRPSEILLRFCDREISTNVALPRPGHYCDPERGLLGKGDVHPFLDMTWSD